MKTALKILLLLIIFGCMSYEVSTKKVIRRIIAITEIGNNMCEYVINDKSASRVYFVDTCGKYERMDTRLMLEEVR